MRHLFALAVAMLALAACAPRPVALLEPTEAPAPGAREVAVLVATTRERAEDPRTLFSGERAGMLDFADVVVSIPPGHVPGQIEWPETAPGDPAREFVTRSRGYVADRAGFVARLDAALAARPPEDRTVGIFVHGFNTNFAEGVYRAAQLAHDNDFQGVPVLFTWASRGEVTDYVYDRDSATAARDALEETLAIAAAARSKDVLLFAHSMGNWVAVEALRQAEIAGRTEIERKLSTVILAAPDIDVDVFKAQMRRLGPPKQPFIMFASSDDRALAVSRLIAGDKPRLGAYTEDAQEIADLGVVVVDLSELQGPDALNHNKFAAVAPEFATRLRASLTGGGSLDVGEETFADATGAIGGTLGSFIGSTAGLVITLPARIITVPLQAITR